MPPVIAADNQEIFLKTLRNVNGRPEIAIEWKNEIRTQVMDIVQKVVVDGEYSKWKKEKQAKESKQKRSPNELTLEDCIDAYTREETLSKDDAFYCSKCKKHQIAKKKIGLMVFS